MEAYGRSVSGIFVDFCKHTADLAWVLLSGFGSLTGSLALLMLMLLIFVQYDFVITLCIIHHLFFPFIH